MFSRQNVNQNAKMIFLGNYFWNLETPVFISYVFITEIYLTNIWHENWRSIFDVVKGLCYTILSIFSDFSWHLFFFFYGIHYSCSILGWLLVKKRVIHAFNAYALPNWFKSVKQMSALLNVNFWASQTMSQVIKNQKEKKDFLCGTDIK